MLKSNSGDFRRVGLRTVLAGGLSVAAISATCVPVAAADNTLTPAVCAASSTFMGALAKGLAEGAGRFKGAAILAAAAGGGAACLPAISSLLEGKSADFKISTPKGGTISRRMTIQDLESNRPVKWEFNLSRAAQCRGWKLDQLYQACLRYDLDPLYN